MVRKEESIMPSTGTPQIIKENCMTNVKEIRIRKDEEMGEQNIMRSKMLNEDENQTN